MLTPAPAIPDESVRSEVEKIRASAALGGSPRLCRFLSYVVEQTLAGHGDDLKEYLIGVEVYDRPPSYDPGIDSIVRSGAQRLRSKLKQYFESEGLRDELLVNFRPGSYVPIFRLRECLPADTPAELPARDGDEPRLSLAVLPFANLGADSDADAFADGLTEEITQRVSQISGIDVVARRSAFQFKNRTADLQSIGMALGVNLVLEGTVRSSGSQIRVTAELANTADGHQLWSAQCDREMSGILAIQDEIASAIVSTLRPQNSGFRASAHVPQTVDLEAYSLYLRGRQLWHQQSHESLWTAIACFEAAIRKWPTYARAHAGLADSYLALTYLGALAPKDGMPSAKAAALRALELDDHLVEAITSLASLALFYEWDWAKSERLFSRAIRLGAGATVHYLYGLLLTATGRFDDGLEHLGLAERFDPLATEPRVATGLAYYRHRDYDLALEHLKQALALAGDAGEVYWCLSLIYIQQNQVDQALENVQKARALAGSNPSLLASVGEVYARAGRQPEAQQVLEALGELAHSTYVSPVNRALLYLALGESNAALEYLRQGFDERAPWMMWLNVDPRYDAIRDEPRFLRLVEKMCLVRPLTASGFPAGQPISPR
jgi:TolB-like protein/Flp pilus assembly protein TadD